jgi:hypothetical protein
MVCEHLGFAAEVNVNRIADEGQPLRFVAEVQIRCDCGEAFRFLGVPPGLDFERPTVSVDGLTLNAPIEPERIPMLAQRMDYRMPPVIPK